ncbi:SDR family NAD(P)-dependent oxidoreductase [Microvirga pudoricolor]|uniref:SDR family NAD(P)-dependent oxidoreductase n=1 Tax=Microvirga pudoricolor TaxID=2778729 RepID=UPI0019505116|nr:SDR family NAD(P)-dependent oxidoreductase [Microvirga pudoricolor]MBM6593177.1 SDR family oxidoreductase [Microvirga pudoricolor]
MRSDFQGRHALVTGGGRGIGRAIASSLKDAGARVTILGRDRAALDRAVSEGGAHRGLTADVTDAASVRAAMSEAAASDGPIDFLIANAGAAVSAPFSRSGEDVFRRMIDVNFMGSVHAAQAALEPMTKRGFGRIVAIASTAGLKGYPYVSAYCASKHAVVGFVRSLALETARTGVTVNAVCPGFAETDLVEESLDRIVSKTGRSREEALSELVRHNPQGRLIRPDEVAGTVLWLCGDAAASVTGQAIAVAGGEI